ncbi:hypothetical protein N431DRAFT_458923 [Stipitochalara longipes BDJ]|nr:hypothetical protein N431DRAFT_458923 [Stipitochalara longipes BDJ]
MCHTTQKTHLPCQHTLSTFTPCVAASGFLLPTFLSSIFSPPKCERTSSSLLKNSFCSECSDFWIASGIGEEEARERVASWRRRARWPGGARPVQEEGVGFVSFVKDGIGAGKDGSPGETKSKERNPDSTVEPEIETEYANGDVNLGEAEQERRERSGSTSSICTLWPGNTEDAEVLFSAETQWDVNVISRGEGNGGQRGLNDLGDPEIYARSEDVPLEDGLIHPDAFELNDLEELPSLTVEGFEQQELSVSPRPFPKEGLQRTGGGEEAMLKSLAGL